MRGPLEARFWAKVQRTTGDGCWLWKGATDSHGYGRIGLGGRSAGIDGTHRVSWIIAHGPIPDGMWVLHRCDVPACVRPDHLFLGSRSDNMSDCSAKGRLKLPGLRGERHPNSKLDERCIAEMRRRRAAGESCDSIATSFAVDRTNVWLIVSGRAWRESEAVDHA